MIDERRLGIARDFGLQNVAAIANASEQANVPFAVACALIEKESGGRNVYGHDEGGALAGFPGTCNEDNYEVFWWMVFQKGMKSNGVGPAQITSKGLLQQMADDRLDPWFPLHNIFFGLTLLKQFKQTTGSWEGAGTRYNGSPEYGKDLARKIEQWQERFGS